MSALMGIERCDIARRGEPGGVDIERVEAAFTALGVREGVPRFDRELFALLGALPHEPMGEGEAGSIADPVYEPADNRTRLRW